MPRVRIRPEDRLFSIGQAAWFFDQTTQWLRWRERQGKLKTSDGVPILPERKASNKMGGGDRRYTIGDVREIAHALRRAEIIDNDQLETVLARVEAFGTPLRKSRKRGQSSAA